MAFALCACVKMFGPGFERECKRCLVLVLSVCVKGVWTSF